MTASIRLTVASLLFVTHTEPSPTATPAGPLPTVIVCPTRPARVSRRDTVPVSPLVTHTAPAPTAIPLGLEFTGTVWLTVRLVKSIRDTVLALRLATHSEPSAEAKRDGAAPSDTCAAITPPAGLMAPTEFALTADEYEAPPLDERSTITATAIAAVAARPTVTPSRRRRAGCYGGDSPLVCSAVPSAPRPPSDGSRFRTASSSC